MPVRAAKASLLVSFTVLTVAFSFGLFSLPVFYPFLTRTYGWNRAQAAAGGSIVLLLIGILGPVIGRLSDKYSPKAVLLAGMCVGAVSLVLLSTTQSLMQWYLFCGLLGVGTAAVSLVPASMLIAPWFAGKRGTAVGVINAGVGVGGFLAPNLTRALIEHYSVSRAFLALALCMAIPFVLTLALAKRSPARPTQPRADAPKAGGVAASGLFWMLGLSLFFSAHTLTGIQQHLVLYLTGQGVKAASAAAALSFLLGASAFGKLFGGIAADRFSARMSLLFSIPCLAIAIAGLLLIAPQAGIIFLVAAVFGLGYGGVFNAPSIIAFEYFGTERVGTILGLFMMFFGLGTSSGGLVAGAIFDRTHNYVVSFTVDLASCTLAFILLLALGLRGRRPAPLAAALEKKCA